MIFKCKICGGSLDVHIGERTAVCEYCGVEQTIPSFIDIKAQEIYNIASNYLAHNEFDKAENLYAQILVDNKSDADAYWNILMCRYGVTYVKDPATEKYIPTCNRTLYAPIFNDENYKNAIKYADEKQRALFEANAKIIDDIQKGILSVSSKEKPFDIFISYKETDANGARTKDSIAAQDLYEKLTAEGYKVFFSRITLEDKVGTEYEPYIYAALASSKVMVTVSSSKENLESVWVKNEWSRFLSFMGKDSGKTLIPLYFDMDKSDLPDDFAHMPSYDMKIDGFEQDLIRGIKKLIPLPVMLLERRKKRNKILKRVGIAAAACAVIAAICAIPWFMKLPKYNAAMQLYYDKNYPEATWAFADLGNYRNSDKMKEKCELSWRKSVADVRYVTSNGEARIDDSFSDNDFKINEHGRIISLNYSDPCSSDLGNFELGDFRVYKFIDALYEDGHIMNCYKLSKAYSYEDHFDVVSSGADEYDTAQWHNIIQIISTDVMTVALRSDGKILLQKHYDGFNTDTKWLENTTDWENITRLYGKSGFVIGVKSNGTICMAENLSSNENAYYDETGFLKFAKILKELTDIKSIAVFNNVNTRFFDMAALTKHNILITYINGKYEEISIENAVDVLLDDEGIITLSSNGDVTNLSDNKVILKDVVHIQEDYFVTRSGSVYSRDIYSGEIKNENVKSAVYNEWIERLQ